jgi:VCBS repeat-containing protein
VAALVVGSASVPSAAPAQAGPATVTISGTSPAGSFSPNGDGYDDTVNVNFCLDAGANVTATATDDAGERVRTIAQAVSYPATCGNSASWDGRDDAGTPVPDGTYTLELEAVNASGSPTRDSVEVVVDRRVPGVVVAPEPGATLSGTASFEFDPTDGFEIASVDFVLSGSGGVSCQAPRVSAADADGVFRASLDTSVSCGDGPRALTAQVQFTDALGGAHWWVSPGVPVTLSNPAPPAVAVRESGPRVFSPNADGQDDTLGFYYCTADAVEGGELAVTVRVLDAAGAVVRSLVEESRAPAPACDTWWLGYFSFGQWDGLDDNAAAAPDGDYTIEVRATDPTDAVGVKTLEVVVDRRVPGVVVAPEPGATLSGTASFEFDPTDGFEINQLQYYVASGGASIGVYNASPDGIWRTTYPVGQLPVGPTDLWWQVQWTDEFGATHYHGGQYEVAIDPTSIPLLVEPDPSSGQAPLDVAFKVTASDPNSEPLHLSIDFGDSSADHTSTITTPYEPVAVTHTYDEPGTYLALVSVSNGRGGYSSQTVPIAVSGQPNSPPVVDASTAPTSGTAPLDVATTINATDPDDDALTYIVDHGDGTSPVTGPLPAAEPIAHRYTGAGTYIVRTQVTDGELTVSRTSRITVAPGEPLVANAGDDRSAVEGDTLQFDASGSRPLAAITSHHWDFGDGSTSTEASPKHTYDEAGSYEVALTVGSGTATAQDTATVVIQSQPPTPGLGVTVTSSGSPVSGADVVVIRPDGSRIGAATDDEGNAHLDGLPDGEVSVYVWADGFVPASRQVVVTDGSGSADVELTSGEIATAVLETRRLEYEEIIDLGIDPEDPANQNVYEFEVNLGFGPSTATPKVYVNDIGLVAIDGCRSDCSVSVGEMVWYPTVHRVGGQPVLQWLVMPGRASFLKEFFEIKLVVQNLAPADFVFTDGVAELNLPAGLALAPTAAPQALTADLADIVGQEKGIATWVVRGDTEGEYTPTAAYSGVLQPLGKPVHLSATALNPLKVWGGSALRMVIDADDAATDGHPYHVRMGLENVADISVYNAAVELLTEGKENYIYQPRQQLGFESAVIEPGQTFWTEDYILVPTITGTLDVASSLVRQVAGDTSLDSTTVSHPARDPDDVPEVWSHAVGPDKSKLEWAAVEGAEGYEVYATPDRETDFPPEPVATVDADTTEATVEGAGISDDVFAVSTSLDGTNTMVHSVADERLNGAPILVPPTPRNGTRFDMQLGSSGTPSSESFTIKAEDPEGDPIDYVWDLRQAAAYRSLAKDEEVSCTPDVEPRELSCEVAPVSEGLSVLSVYAVDANGAKSFVNDHVVGATSLKYAALGDSYSSGEGVDPYFMDGPGFTENEPKDNRCHRSTRAYAEYAKFPYAAYSFYELASGAPDREPGSGKDVNKFGLETNERIGVSNADTDWMFWACASAVTDNVTSKAQGSINDDPELNFDRAPQLDHGSIDLSTDVVTLTIGGNDVKFSEVMQDCALDDCFAGAEGNVYRESLERSISGIYSDLVETYRAALNTTGNARLIVLGYPQFFWDDAIPALCPTLALWSSEMATLNDLAGDLNDVIKRAAATAGVEFVDVRPFFENHELCNSGPYDSAWINPTHWTFHDMHDWKLSPLSDEAPVGDVNDESFHPTLEGHRDGYAAALNACLAREVSACRSGERSPADTTLVQQGQEVHQNVQLALLPSATSVAFRTGWPGSDVEMTLTSPSGRVVERTSDDADVAHVRGPTYESYQVDNPEPGEWTVTLYGADVDPDGEPVELDVTQLEADGTPVEETPSLPPNAVADAGPTLGPPPLSVSFDATQSDDPDGTISQYTWDFGDGTIGASQTTSHLYSSPGTYIATLTVIDDQGNESVSTPIRIIAGTVEPPDNEAARAVGDEFTVDRDRPLEVPAPGVLGNDTDVDGDALTARAVSEPVNGSLSLAEDGSFTYTPDPGFEGYDQFTYVANDGTLDSLPATVALVVQANVQPLAVDDDYTVVEDSPLTMPGPGVLGNDSDPEGSSLTAEIDTEPEHGAIELAADGSFTYTPEADFADEDSFTYRASDGTATSEPATVTVTVTPANDAPVATNDEFEAGEDEELVVDAPGVLDNDTDVDGDDLAAMLASPPSHGTLALSADGSFTYTPEPGYSGADSFTYQANDGAASSELATVNFAIEARNDGPVASPDAYGGPQGQSIVVEAPGVLGNDNDPEGDALTAVLVSEPSNGQLDLAADGSFTYTTNAGFVGTDSFTYAADDGGARSDEVTVILEITDLPNTAPTAADDDATVAAGDDLVVGVPGVLGNDTDPDGDDLSAVLVTGPTHGSLVLVSDGGYTYTPDLGFDGTDTFTYVAHDGTAASEAATVTITVTPVNRPPIASGDIYAANQDEPLTVDVPGVLGNDTDPDGDPLSAELATGPGHGQIELMPDGALTYVPEPGFTGTDSFTYTARDGSADSEPVTVTIEVAAVNHPPVAGRESYGIQAAESLAVAAPGVLANDTDPDADELTAVLVSDVTHGKLELLTDGSFNYTPDDGFSGTDTFTYKANDGVADSEVATVTLQVTPRVGPALSMSDAAPVAEPERGAVYAEFVVSLSSPATERVTVHVSTVDGTAVAADGDYRSIVKDLSFSPGTMSKVVNVPVRADSVTEDEEQFALVLSGASRATIRDGVGVGTILAGGTPPALSVSDAAPVAEPERGAAYAEFVVSLSSPATERVTVHVSTADGTAVAADGDYRSTVKDLSFSPGTTSTVVKVRVLADRYEEPEEQFTLSLSDADGASIADGSAVGTILDRS